MRIIKATTLRGYAERYADARPWLSAWAAVVRAAEWSSINDVRKVYPHADSATADSGAVVTIFNVKKNTYRLIVAIHYNTGRVYVRDFMTHAAYDDQRWKARH